LTVRSRYRERAAFFGHCVSVPCRIDCTGSIKRVIDYHVLCKLLDIFLQRICVHRSFLTRVGVSCVPQKKKTPSYPYNTIVVPYASLPFRSCKLINAPIHICSSLAMRNRRNSPTLQYSVDEPPPPRSLSSDESPHLIIRSSTTAAPSSYTIDVLTQESCSFAIGRPLSPRRMTEQAAP